MANERRGDSRAVLNESFMGESHESRMNPASQLSAAAGAVQALQRDQILQARENRMEVAVPQVQGRRLPVAGGVCSGSRWAPTSILSSREVGSGVDCVRRWAELSVLREGGRRGRAFYLLASRDRHGWLRKG